MRGIVILVLFFFLLGFGFGYPETSQYKILENGYVEIDSIPVCNHDFRFGFVLSENDMKAYPETMYAKVFPTASDGRILPQTVYKPVTLSRKGSSDVYAGSFRVPEGIAGFTICLTTGRELFATYDSPYYLVSMLNGLPVPGVNSLLMTRSSVSEYMEYFNDERRLYPDDILAYALRWTYEGRKNLLMKDSLIQQLTFLEEHYGTHPDYPYVALLGKHLAYHTIDTKLLQKIRTEKNAPALNVDAVAYGLLTILHQEPGALADLIRNNPYSIFAKMPLYRAEYEGVDPYALLDAINTRRTIDSDALLDFHRAFILTMSVPDSLQVAYDILSGMVDKIQNAYPFFAHGEDPDVLMYLTTSRVYDAISRVCVKMEKYTEAIRYLEMDKADLLESQDHYLGIIYLHIGSIERTMGNENTALENYTQARYYLPTFGTIRDSLRSIYDLRKTQSTAQFETWCDSLSAALTMKDVFLPKGLPPLQCQDEKVDIYDLDAPSLVVFVREGCHFCDLELADVIEYYKDNATTDNDVYVVTDNVKKFSSRFGELPANFRLVQNAGNYNKKFGITSYPVSMVIGKSGAMHTRLTGYSSRQTIFDLLARMNQNT